MFETTNTLNNLSITEIVYVGTFTSMHAEQCIQLMNAGKNVLCEKPMALNLKKAKQVLETAKKNDVFFMEVRIWLPRILVTVW